MTMRANNLVARKENQSYLGRRMNLVYLTLLVAKAPIKIFSKEQKLNDNDQSMFLQAMSALDLLKLSYLTLIKINYFLC